MKNLLFIASFLVTFKSYAQVRIGLAAGYTSAKFIHSGENPLSDGGNTVSSISSFHAGIISEIPLGKQIFLQPALLYTGGGTHINGHSIDPGIESFFHEIIRIDYLKLPVNAVYKISLAKRYKLMAGAGLYAAKGLAGTGSGDFELSGQTSLPYQSSFRSRVHFSGGNSSYNDINITSFDLGFNFLAGIEWKNVQLTANYSHGFSKVYETGGY